MKTIKSLTEAEIAELPILPDEWKWVKIGDLCDLINGRAFKPSEWSSHGTPIVRIQNLNNEDAEFNCCDFRVEDKYYLNNGQLLFAWSGTPGTSFGAHTWNRGEAVLNQHIFKVNINEFYTDKKFLMYVMNWNVTEYVKKAHGTAGLAHITKNKFETSFIPFPPLPEQRSIVSKIEQLFSELDNGIANLKLAQEQLKVYRQAVLKKAFEGELTREWRKLNSTEESANKLLDLILEKKKIQWENNQLGKFERTGKKPKDKLWKLKYKKPCSPDTANLPDLPKNWSWVSPEQITSWDDPYALAIGPFGSNLKVSDYTSEGVPLVFVRNIRSGIFNNENTKYVSNIKAEELRPHWINSLDILITKMGEPPGDACLYPVGHPLAIITADCIKFRLCSLLDNPIYFVYAINSNIVRSQISSITSGVAQKKISLERFKTIALPLPPTQEQQAIVQEIETRLSVCDKIEQDIETNLEKAEALRQSILKKAFEGKLLNERELAEVRGAEDWEPAEVLMERIRAEKAQNGEK